MKFHERAYAQIDLGALKHNVSQVIENTDKATEIIAVVKADAYGHGVIPVTKAIKECGVKRFGVAIADEAIELRENGINDRILILGAGFSERAADVVNYDIEQTIFTLAMAEKLQHEAAALGKTAKVHLKVDTGMGRVGFLPSDEGMKEIIAVMEMANIEVVGIFTHFACSDHKDKSYSIMQHDRFMGVIDRLRERFAVIPPIHVSNSGGIIDFPGFNYSAVRPGIMLYGIYPSQEVNKSVIKLRPVMSLKASVTNVKTIAPGECVSYNSRFKAERNTVVATIPFGYADGYRRLLGNGYGCVLIHGMRVPTIGDICMDQFMVDATAVSDIKIGDEAVLLGAQGDDCITADEIALICKTIPYEVVCDISKRVPRFYV